MRGRLLARLQLGRTGALAHAGPAAASSPSPHLAHIRRPRSPPRQAITRRVVLQPASSTATRLNDQSQRHRHRRRPEPAADVAVHALPAPRLAAPHRSPAGPAPRLRSSSTPDPVPLPSRNSFHWHNCPAPPSPPSRHTSNSLRPLGPSPTSLPAQDSSRTGASGRPIPSPEEGIREGIETGTWAARVRSRAPTAPHWFEVQLVA